MTSGEQVRRNPKLVAVKIVHTIVWAFFVVCIASIPIASLSRRFRLAETLAGIVFLECLVLACNKGRCPLTDMARRYSADQTSNFDIYLPECLAQHNKAVFGGLFVANLILLAWQFR